MNVTLLFEQYKEATRNLWNVYFLKNGQASWEDVKLFLEIDKLLFEKIILMELGISNREPLTEMFWLKAKSNRAPIPAMVNRTGDSGYWDHSIQILTDDCHILFLEYFDWNMLSIKDNRYILAKILESKTNPDINGYQAIIETQYVDIFYFRDARIES